MSSHRIRIQLGGEETESSQIIVVRRGVFMDNVIKDLVIDQREDKTSRRGQT